MAYSTTSSIATPAALVAQICTFLTANGWTVDRNNLVSSNRTATVHRSGTDYIHIYNDTADEVKLRISVGYDSSLAPDLQPNVQADPTTINVGTGSYPNTFFFASADGLAINVVVATAAAGVYRHIALGILDKAGSYTGGTYVDGSFWGASYPGTLNISFNHAMFYNSNLTSGAIRCDIPDDSKTNYIPTYYGSALALKSDADFSASGPPGKLPQLVESADDNNFSGRSVFHPILAYVKRTVDYWSPLGTYKNIRYCSLKKFVVEQEVAIGSDTWKVFPLARKAPFHNDPTGLEASGNHGFAILKVT